MLDFPGELLNVVSVGGIGTLITVAYFYYFYQLKPSEKVSYARLREDVADGAKWGKAYQRGLSRLLARIDGHVFGQGKQMKPRHPWTSPSLSFCLVLAFAYPFASLLGLWLYAGVNTSGVAGLLPEDADVGSRALLAVLLAWMAFCVWRGQGREGLGFMTWLVAGLGPLVLTNYMGIIPQAAGAGAIVFLQEKASQRGSSREGQSTWFDVAVLLLLFSADDERSNYVHSFRPRKI